MANRVVCRKNHITHAMPCEIFLAQVLVYAGPRGGGGEVLCVNPEGPPVNRATEDPPPGDADP